MNSVARALKHLLKEPDSKLSVLDQWRGAGTLVCYEVICTDEASGRRFVDGNNVRVIDGEVTLQRLVKELRPLVEAECRAGAWVSIAALCVDCLGRRCYRRLWSTDEATEPSAGGGKIVLPTGVSLASYIPDIPASVGLKVNVLSNAEFSTTVVQKNNLTEADFAAPPVRAAVEKEKLEQHADPFVHKPTVERPAACASGAQRVSMRRPLDLFEDSFTPREEDFSAPPVPCRGAVNVPCSPPLDDRLTKPGPDEVRLWAYEDDCLRDIRTLLITLSDLCPEQWSGVTLKDVRDPMFVRKLYRKALLEFHPDKHGAHLGKSEIFQCLHKSYASYAKIGE